MKAGIDKVSQLAGKKAISARKADEQNTIEGTWTFTLGDYYFEESTFGSLTYNFEATLEGTDLWFEDPIGYELPFVADYDASTGTLTFSETYFGTTGTYYINQEPYVYNWDDDDLDVQSITAQYSDDVITFDPDNGISWAAYSDEQLTQPEGYFGIYDLEGAVRAGEKEPEVYDEIQEGQWEYVGMATFVDAWILPSYTLNDAQINPNEYAYEVELQQNKANGNLYRLWKPYKTAGALVFDQELNQSTYDGQIQFDITDPDFVEVVACGLPAGFKDANGEFYMSNDLGWYINYSGYDRETIINLVGDELSAGTYKDGVVTIPEPLFDFSSTYSNGYNWSNSVYSAIITFPKDDINTSIESLSDKGSVRKVVENGQVLILRQDGKKYNLQGVEIK